MNANEHLFIWGYIVFSIIVANLPWVSERLFFIFPLSKKKGPWIRLLEWLIFYLLIGVLGIGLEKQLTGEIYHQNWLFYCTTIAMFVVFALPGFIYRYELNPLFKNKKRKSRNGIKTA